jgi:hypothetical protein
MTLTSAGSDKVVRSSEGLCPHLLYAALAAMNDSVL